MDEDHSAGGGGESSGEVNIREIIRKRKAERRQEAELQRQVGLQRIRDMRPTTGIHPLELCPREIWSMIIDELDPKDKGNLRQVHPLFRDLMESQVVDVLFPQVLFVKDFMWMIHKCDASSWSNKMRLERLRSVSKAMRNSFDVWIEDNDKMYMYQDLVEISLRPFGDNKILDALLASFQGENCARRFFPRKLCVHFMHGQPTFEIVNQFKDKITTLLKIFGDQIWYFVFVTDALLLEEYTFSQVYMILHEWVSLMPNLKFLDINFDFFSSNDQSPKEEEEAVARATLREKPFPRLESLKKIQFIQRFPPERKNIIHQVYEAILVANQQITILETNSSDTLKSTFPSLLVPVIKSLQLTNFQVSCVISSLKEIQRIVNFNWQLHTIYLTFSASRCRSLNLDSVFGVLEKFPTLEDVSLKFGLGFEIGDKPRFLNLPNLNKLKIKFFEPNIDYKCNIHFFFSLQFLLHCKNLKTLNWSILYFNDVKLRNHLKERECRWKMVDFRAGLRFLYESNIWDVFPSLHTVKVKLWKNNVVDEMGCEHEYQRALRGQGFSVGEFLESHACSMWDTLKDCVILFG